MGATIRDYRPGDEAAAYYVCLKTGNSGDDGASDATGAGAYLDYTDGVIAETPGAKAALRTFGGGYGVSPPAARSMRSR